MTFDITKCKPFDLERALAGDEVVTREGLAVTEIHYFKHVNSVYEVYVAVGGLVYACTKEGLYTFPVEDRFDLFMAPKTKKCEAWANVYNWGISGVNYNTKSKAIDNAGKGCIKTIKIETEIEI